MELCLRDNDPTQTTLMNPDGRVLYTIETQNRHTDHSITTVRRLEGRALDSVGHVASEVATIAPAASTRALTLSLSEQNIEIMLHPFLGDPVDTSWAFKGPDGRPYKWKIFIQYPVLFLDDNSHTPIARYRRAKLGIVSRSRRPFLEILPAGINIIDLIVVTFVSFAKQYMTIERGPI